MTDEHVTVGLLEPQPAKAVDDRLNDELVSRARAGGLQSGAAAEPPPRASRGQGRSATPA
ncbi:hypothetical protein [Streptomyces sp. NPDC014623]|uniref:hypothetical protein n=1 Tax=Streptomyces sp. NPDC014623 TaxID=3364875 RepID=UPI0036F9856C